MLKDLIDEFLLKIKKPIRKAVQLRYNLNNLTGGILPINLVAREMRPDGMTKVGVENLLRVSRSQLRYFILSADPPPVVVEKFMGGV